tara:strand:+ start:791 stop:1939 length:1149 start_codon:yes stop_codon:yes gene_type:complete
MANPVDLNQLFSNEAERKAFTKAFGTKGITKQAIIDRTLEPLGGYDLYAAAELLAAASHAQQRISKATSNKRMSSTERTAAIKNAQATHANIESMTVDYIAIGKSVTVPGILVSFQDQYDPTWNTEPVYGRMDPLVTYQGTTRKITLSYQVDLDANAFDVAGGVGDLIKFLYPAYQGSSMTALGTGTISAPPLWRIKLSKNDMLGGSKGVLIAVDSFDLEKWDSGMKDNVTAYYDSTGHYRPTKMTFSIGGYVFHEDAKPGWVWESTATTAAGSQMDLIGFAPGTAWPYGHRAMYYDTPGVSQAGIGTESDHIATLTAENKLLAGTQSSLEGATADLAAANQNTQDAQARYESLKADVAKANGTGTGRASSRAVDTVLKNHK